MSVDERGATGAECLQRAYAAVREGRRLAKALRARPIGTRTGKARPSKREQRMIEQLAIAAHNALLAGVVDPDRNWLDALTVERYGELKAEAAAMISGCQLTAAISNVMARIEQAQQIQTDKERANSGDLA